MRPGDKIYLRHDGDNMRGYVVESSGPGVATVAIHDDSGMLLFSVTDAKIATKDADRKVDGFIYPRS